MQRLLADAEALTGVHYDISNLGDVYEAIHVIQGELGLTGVAAAEAEGTFTGSFASMQAAAKNFLGELALGMDVTDSLNVLVTSASTFFFSNFLPMLGNIVRAIPGAIGTFLQQGLPALINSISSLLISLTEYISSTADGLSSKTVSQWATKNIPRIMKAGAQLIGKLAAAFIINLPKIVAAIGRIGFTIIHGLGAALWGKVTAAAQGIKERFMAPINNIIGLVQGVIAKIKGFFPISIGRILSNVKLPHFSISGSFSLNPPSVPKLSISWYAKGGIIDGATVLGGVGLGEAGPEAILPLDPFWKKMDDMTKSMSGGNTVNIYINGSDKNPKEIAEEVKRVLIRETNQRRLAWQ